MADLTPHDGRPQRALKPAKRAARPPRRSTRAKRIDQGDRSFGRSVGWTLLGTVIPGAGLLKTRYRWLGVAMLTFTLLAIALLGIGFVTARGFLLGLAVRPGVLNIAAASMAVFGVIWVASIVATHLALRPLAPRAWQRVTGTLLIGALSLLVALPTFVAARNVYDTADFMKDVFTPAHPNSTQTETTDPFVDSWADRERLNVLVLGGDSGRSRNEKLGARTDTVIVASIDTQTGNTVLFSLPRQTGRIPFPPGSPMAQRWPNGFTDGNPNNAEYFLNSIYHNVPASLGEGVVGDVKDPGAEVLKQAVGTALGLDIDYYVMVNMDGFIEFVDALGGITVNISKPVAMGGITDKKQPPDRWLEPGPDRHLDGREALWYARGRYGTDDYERMRRQRCVIQAVSEQANPVTVLANYEAITKAGKNIISTDVPPEALPPLMELALKVKGKPFRSVSFENGKFGFSTVTPNWELVQGIVSEAITLPSPTASPSASPTATTTKTPSPTASATASESPTAKPTSPIGETDDECGYNPVPYDPNEG